MADTFFLVSPVLNRESYLMQSCMKHLTEDTSGNDEEDIVVIGVGFWGQAHFKSCCLNYSSAKRQHLIICNSSCINLPSNLNSFRDCVCLITTSELKCLSCYFRSRQHLSSRHPAQQPATPVKRGFGQRLPSIFMSDCHIWHFFGASWNVCSFFVWLLKLHLK